MTETDSPARPWLGFFCGLGAALCFSSGVMLSPTVFANGGNAPAIVTARLALLLPIFLGYAYLARRPVALPFRARLFALSLGAITACQTLAIFTSYRYIPISLATLIEYSYPLLTLLAMRALYGEALTWGRLVAFAAAITGIWLALRVDFAEIHPLGIALAFTSALIVGSRMIASGRFLRTSDPVRLLIHMQMGGLAVALPVFGLSGSIALPDGAAGIGALLGMSALSGTGTLLSLTAIKLAGPSRTAMAQTGEVVFTVGLAALLLGESLTPQKFLGAGLVLTAVLGLQFLRAKGVRPARPADGEL
ncbi:MAG: DMT family transporter [Proteobacteria bacterium]|nr:DMT family transporter [Pseudomonadota bacterium]